MKTITNLHLQPVSLADGTILAAAGHEGSTKQVPDVSQADGRLVARGLIGVSDAPLRAVASKPESAKETK